MPRGPIESPYSELFVITFSASSQPNQLLMMNSTTPQSSTPPTSDPSSIFSPQLKVVLFLFYSVVFLTAFFGQSFSRYSPGQTMRKDINLICYAGNLLVILVIFMSRKMHSVTNYFLANLAFCDLCVSLFCVYQNYALYVTSRWMMGNTMCKLYHFVQSLSYTSSIISMLLISVERYIAIVHPMKARRLLQMRNFLITLAFIWSFAAISCTPRLFMFGLTRSLCMIRQGYTTQVHIFNLIYVILLLLLPALVMSVLYVRLCCRLYSKRLQVTYISNRTNVRFKRPKTAGNVKNGCHLCPGVADTSSSSSCVRLSGDVCNNNATRLSTMYESRVLVTGNAAAATGSEYVTAAKADTDAAGTTGNAFGSQNDAVVVNHQDSFRVHVLRNGTASGKCRGKSRSNEPQLMSVLCARRKVIRLLIIIVISFIVCHSPYHFRKLIQDWSNEYEAGGQSAILFTIATNLLMYSNSSINPIIYTLLSEKFRTSIIILYHKVKCWK
jgi:hypothetical protein